jgi:hypothetical protein
MDVDVHIVMQREDTIQSCKDMILYIYYKVMSYFGLA